MVSLEQNSGQDLKILFPLENTSPVSSLHFWQPRSLRLLAFGRNDAPGEGTQSPGGKGAQEVGGPTARGQRRKRETGGLERVLLWRGATNRRKGRAPECLLHASILVLLHMPLAVLELDDT